MPNRICFIHRSLAVGGVSAVTDTSLSLGSAQTDTRIDVNALKKNVGAFPSDERDQNSMWYRLYKQVENEVSVLESHQE